MIRQRYYTLLLLLFTAFLEIAAAEQTYNVLFYNHIRISTIKQGIESFITGCHDQIGAPFPCPVADTGCLLWY